MSLLSIPGLALLVSMLPPSQTFDHALWDRVLKAYVNDLGEVDYAGLKTHRRDLDEYVRRLEEFSPVNRPDLFPTQAHELAYWMNAYNAFVMRGVVDNYPTRSVRDLGALYGFFRHKDYTAGGARMSLVQLENEIIRKRYHEPRIHFGIVCASISCPRLSRQAFTADNLETQLDQLARQFVNERRNLTIDSSSNEVILSAIFKWYKEDFERSADGSQKTILDFVGRYANPGNRKLLDSLRKSRIKYYDYDWSINELGSRARAKSPLDRELVQASNATGS